MSTTDFVYADCELDFGSFSLGGDWLLKIETADDGFSFRLLDAESCSKGVPAEAFALIQKWIDADTAPRARGSNHKSLVRQAYTDALIERDENRAEDRGCHDFHQMRGAA